MDALVSGVELYNVDIVGGEPVVEKLDPLVVRILRSGYSNKIEDADMIVLEEYWSPGKVLDYYWDQLSKKDVEEIDKAPNGVGDSFVDEMANEDARYGFVNGLAVGDCAQEGLSLNTFDLFDNELSSSLLPYDTKGNIRVLRVYWKSRRKIKKIKSYDPITGEEQYDIYPESYVAKKELGEEEEVFWINEAWGGVKIGKDVYVDMGPRPIQYNRLSNPSKCHFGIIGSIYNINGDIPYTVVDMMKPLQYLYDVMHDRLNKILAKNKGKVIRLDLAKVPKGWSVDKWLYYVGVNSIAVEDSFKEGDYGVATGKIAGALNNASSGVVDASLGTEIQQYISLLEWIVNKIGEVAGISKQREGQVSNRETVGGVERATLQSSHITEWLFFIHESVKKRVLETLLENAKIALKGRSKKFSYILPGGSEQIIEIDGDEFAENDYGLIVDNSSSTQELQQNLLQLAHAALQNQLIDFSTMIKMFTTKSVSEKQWLIETNERMKYEQAQQQQQQQMQLQQQQIEQQAKTAEMQAQQQYKMHSEDNDTKVLVAQINAQAEAERFAMMNDDSKNQLQLMYNQEMLTEKARQFDEKLKLDKEKLDEQVRANRKNEELKLKNINKQNN